MLEKAAAEIRAEIARLTTALEAIENIDGYSPRKPRKVTERLRRRAGFPKKSTAAPAASGGHGKRAPRPA